MLKINIIYNPVFPNFFFNIFQHLSTQAVSALKSSKMRLFTPLFPTSPYATPEDILLLPTLFIRFASKIVTFAQKIAPHFSADAMFLIYIYIVSLVV